MALVLSLRVGEDFYVGTTQFFLDSIEDDTKFRLRRAPDGKAFNVDEAMAVEITEEVFASAGEKHQAGVARLAIDAPRSILIIRGDKYRNPPEHVRAQA